MTILKPSTENEMVLHFLKMEYQSERWAGEIEAALENLGVNPKIITSGNLDSEEENAARVAVLGQFRGYPTAELFTNFPEEIDWCWAVFGGDDLPRIFYIEYSYWNELSNYTGKPIEAAKTIAMGKTIFDVPNDGFLKAAKHLELQTESENAFPPMIFLTDSTRYIILEGHLRMTAYALVPEAFENVSVILGRCSSADLDKWYGTMPEKGTR